MLKNNKIILMLLVIIGLLALNGCASISTKIACSKESKWLGEKTCNNNNDSMKDGITYYLPRRDIRINFSIKESEKGKVITVTIPNNYATDNIPDTDNVFVLSYNKNYIGDNNMSIGVNSMGLLTVTHADTVNKINEIATNIGADIALATYGVGSLSNNNNERKPLSTTPIIEIDRPNSVALADRSVSYTSNTCKLNEGDYSILFNPKELPNNKIISICEGIKIEISRLFIANHLHDSFRINPDGFFDNLHNLSTLVKNSIDVIHLHNKGFDNYSGLFYKQEMPYAISVYNPNYCNESSKRECENYISQNFKSQFIALSPNESPIYFAPITQTLFSDNVNDITLINGVVNSLKENTDSELLALTQIPANVIGGYSSAIGNALSSLQSKETIITTTQNTELATLVNAEKIKRCQVAIATNDTKNKTGDDLTKAFNNIQTACGN
jgi:uncharacterized protein YceK